MGRSGGGDGGDGVVGADGDGRDVGGEVMVACLRELMGYRGIVASGAIVRLVVRRLCGCEPEGLDRWPGEMGAS